jgi:hypothetical protein
MSVFKLPGSAIQANTITATQISSPVLDTSNNAYDQANSSANTVRVSQNNASILSSKQLNFVNTATVTVAVTDSGNGNANIAFTSTGGGGGSGAVADGAIYENSLNISSNYTITANKSAFSVGPINIANGVSVTIPTGSKWVIL